LKPPSAQRLEVVACTVAKAQRAVTAWHRHHGPVPPGYAFWALACVVPSGRVCGVAIVGRPTNRNSDTGYIVEVLRIATDGTPNACSALLGACGRVAKAAGVAKIITYTLDSESGASLKGAGWTMEASGIESWWARSQSPGRTVKPRAHYNSTKRRWARVFREPGEDLLWPDAPDAPSSRTLSLFGDR